LCNCTPDCAGKVCGSDACGGSCGTCVTGQCVSGACNGATSAERWRQAGFALPNPRFAHAQVDFESKQKVVLYGGRSDPTTYGDTLVLDYTQASQEFTSLSTTNFTACLGD